MHSCMLDTYHSSQNPPLFSFWFFKKSLSSEPTLPQTPPRKPSPHTPLLHRENSSRTPLSFECWNSKPVYVLRKTLSHFNLQTIPPIPNPSEPTILHTSEPTVPEHTSPFIVESPNPYQFFEIVKKTCYNGCEPQAKIPMK